MDVGMTRQEMADDITNLWIQMNRINDVHIGPRSDGTDAAADVFETVTKVFAAMARDEHEPLSVVQQSGKRRRQAASHLARHLEQRMPIPVFPVT